MFSVDMESCSAIRHVLDTFGVTASRVERFFNA